MSLFTNVAEEKKLQPVQSEEAVYTVSTISSLLQKTIESNFAFIKVKGEISGFKKASSGHLYFTLKDETATLNVICWKNVASNLEIRPEDGMEVVCSGKISTYPGRSIYQLMANNITVAGVGALLAMLEKRRKKLQQEGLFDVAHKKSLPFLPQTIGIITSIKGAVIRDIVHRIKERFPVRLIVWDVLVQGSECADQVTKAIIGFNDLPQDIPKPDLLIVARGGGSIEDLWPFNEECVVRAAFNSSIPIISAVGHETDTTLIDYAADKRAPTPTAAAEIAVPVRSELDLKLEANLTRLKRSLLINLKNQQNGLTNLGLRLSKCSNFLDKADYNLDFLKKRISHILKYYLEARFRANEELKNKLQITKLQSKIQDHYLNLEQCYQNLNNALKQYLYKLDQQLTLSGKLLNSYSYHNTLKRGFTLIHSKSGKLITSAKSIKNNEALNIEFYDGKKEVIATASKRARSKPISKQNSLFD